MTTRRGQPARTQITVNRLIIQLLIGDDGCEPGGRSGQRETRPDGIPGEPGQQELIYHHLSLPWHSDYIYSVFNGIPAGQAPFAGDTPT
jgi:hypothetical protein